METGVKEKLRSAVLSEIDLSGEMEDDTVNEAIDRCILRETSHYYIPLKEKVRLKTELFHSLRRLDVLSELLENDAITEIMINGTEDIFVEENGFLHRVNRRFESREKLLSVIQQIASGANRIVNEARPIMDAILPDGSRVNVVLESVAKNGPIVTIRKFPKQVLNMERLIELEAIDQKTARVLELLVRAGYNIFISGGTGAGKTTFLNALAEYIPEDERVITIEDSAELQIRGLPNLVRMEARNGNVEGNNQISIRELIKTSLRMRPNRVIIGEVRDAAAIDMLTAMNTGHDGSISTGHANSARDMLLRLESMVLMGVDLPLMAIRQQIASALDIIIHLGRLRDKTRRVLQIDEVLGVKNGEIELNGIYEFEERAEYNGRISGRLSKVNDLMQVSKLSAAGLLGIYREEQECEDE
jgi:pilus assembly protein CpaF